MTDMELPGMWEAADFIDTSEPKEETEWQDKICIHELRFGQCALCVTSDWHVGIQAAKDDRFAASLIKNFDRTKNATDSRRSDIPVKDGEGV